MKFDIHAAMYNGFAYRYATFRRDASQAQPYLLFIGGAFQDIRASYKICRELSQWFNVICVEVPGSGQSDLLPEYYDFGYIAEILYDLIQNLNIKETHLIGCSYGSPIAYRFAQKFPNSVSRMVLTGVMKEIPACVRREVEESVFLIENGSLEDFDALISHLFFNLEKTDDIEGQTYIKNKFSLALSQMSIESKMKYSQNTRRLLASTLSPFPQVNTPVLVVTGEYDNFTSPEYCGQFAAMCKNVEFTLVNKSDHFFHVEQARTTINLVSGFLLGEDISAIEGHSRSHVGQPEMDAAAS